MNRTEKAAEIEELGGILSKAKFAVVAEYSGLSVAQITAFRKSLKAAGSFGRVAKNTLARVAVKEKMRDVKASELDSFINLLDGMNMLIVSETDPVSSAKAVAKFSKDNEKLKVKGAIMEGAFIDAKGVEALSKLPSREETFGMLLALINTPATQLLRVINETGAQVARVVDAHRKNLEKAA
jgi:large subunit ribosomal protein L10